MILQRYILRQLGAAFLFTFAAMLFICLVGMIFQSLKLYAGVGLHVVAQTVPTALAYMAPWALVIAVCAATTTVYARLSADQELDAVLVSGIHPLRIFLPAILFAAGIGAVSFLIHDVAAPYAHYRRRIMIREAVLFLLQSPPPGHQTFDIGKYTLSYTNFSGGVMERPIVLDNSERNSRYEYHARSGHFQLVNGEMPIIILQDGEGWEETSEHHNRITGKGDITITLDLERLDQKPKGYKDMSASEMRELLKTDLSPKLRAEVQTERYARFAWTASPLFLVLLCIPIGVLTRKGSRMAGLGAALPPFLLYLVCTLLGEGLGKRGQLPPIGAAWFAEAVLLACAVPLLAKVYRR